MYRLLQLDSAEQRTIFLFESLQVLDIPTQPLSPVCFLVCPMQLAVNGRHVELVSKWKSRSNEVPEASTIRVHAGSCYRSIHPSSL